MTRLACTDLCVGYSGMPVAEHIDFCIGDGELLCIVGENGIGKSTLVKTLLGIIPPISGELQLDYTGHGKGVGYLPQRGESQRDFPASAGEIALSGRLVRIGPRAFFGKRDREAARRALDRVGALEWYDEPFNRLSGGQQQRVLLARALCATSSIIVLDEPTTGLDPEATQSLYQILDSLRADGMAIIIVSHDVDAAISHATHVLAFEHVAPQFFSVADYRAHRHARLCEVE